MHNLFGKRFVGVRQPGWHKIGTVIDEPVTTKEALVIGGITYSYISSPIGYTLPDGTFVQSEDRVAVLRTPTEDDPTYRRMGIVASNYTYLQNDELAAGLDAISEATGWKLETVGALGNGGLVFLTLNAGGVSVKGDEYKQFLIVSDGKASGRALNISVANVRVVCENTLLASDSAASIAVRVAHDPGVALSYDFWLKTVAGLEKVRAATLGQLDTMASTKISKEQAQKVFDVAFPYPRMNDKARLSAQLDDTAPEEIRAALKSGVDAWEATVAWTQKHREGCMELYDRFNHGEEQGGKMKKMTLEKVRETPYAALQAVTELCDWSGGGSDIISATSAIFGYKAGVKKRAWAAAYDLSTIGLEAR